MENVNVIRTGFMAPEFALADTQGEIFDLKDNLSGNFLCVCFFPDGDNDKVITYLRDLNQGFPATAAGLPINVIGVSPARSSRLKALKEKHKLNFPILSDPHLSVCSRYYIVNSYSPKPAVHFSVFIIDDAGIVRFRSSEIPGISRFSFDELKSEIPKLL